MYLRYDSVSYYDTTLYHILTLSGRPGVFQQSMRPPIAAHMGKSFIGMRLHG